MNISFSAAASAAYTHACQPPAGRQQARVAGDGESESEKAHAPQRLPGHKASGDCDDKKHAEDKKQAGRPNAMRNAHGEILSQEDEDKVRQLQQRDREVRAHEMAHVAAGGGLILRGAVYDYQTGPDNKRYAVGGDVIIDTSPARKPEDTIIKARRIRAAALAPADPSPQDRSVAQKADQMARDAQMEIATRQREKMQQAHSQSSPAADETGSKQGKRADDSGDDAAQATSGSGKYQQIAGRLKALYEGAASAEGGSASSTIHVYA